MRSPSRAIVSIFVLASSALAACHSIIGYDDLTIVPSCADCDAGLDAAPDAAPDATPDATLDADGDAVSDGGVGDASAESALDAPAADAGDGAPPPLDERAWPVPHSGGEGTPVAKYDVSVPGYVLDEITGLQWTATGTAATFTWAEAQTECAKPRNGKSDWRLPSVLEHTSLLNPGGAGAIYVDRAGFTQDETGYYWARDEVASAPGTHWLWTFGEPRSSAVGAGSDRERAGEHARVRCVRTERLVASGARFVASAAALPDGGTIQTVVDRHTRLEWERFANALPWMRDDAVSMCAALGAGFRLPTAKELFTLVDLRRTSPPATFVDFFGDTSSGTEPYWSSSSGSDGTTTHYLGVGFHEGTTTQWTSAGLFRVARCVRAAPAI